MRTSVVIAGGGPVGLTLSILLAAHGVEHLLVEPRTTVSEHPKARGISSRSMEIFRRQGLEPAIRAAGLPPSATAFFYGRSLVDPDFTRSVPEVPETAYTPSPGLVCSQHELEPVLRARVSSAEFGVGLESFTQDAESVRVRLSDGRTVTAGWLIGCDGAHSTVRSLAGIGMPGKDGLGEHLSIRFDAPLGEAVADRASAVYFLSRELGGFMAVDNDRHWIYHRAVTGALPTPEESVARIRAAAGIPDLPVTLLSSATWRVTARLAETYRRGRVLLAGTPPTASRRPAATA